MKKSNATKLSNSLICNLDKVARLGRATASRFFEKNKSFGISFNDFLILEALFDTPKINQKQLAKLILRETGNLSRDLEKLENRNFIKRTLKMENNRTVKILELTQVGNDTYLEICEQCLNHVEEIEKIFSKEELKLFINNITKVKEFLTHLNISTKN